MIIFIIMWLIFGAGTYFGIRDLVFEEPSDFVETVLVIIGTLIMAAMFFALTVSLVILLIV